jgi:4-hydroxyproline epimerase
MTRIHVVDSHTEGEPTRVVVGDLGVPVAPMSQRLRWLRENDHLRTGLALEPRGSNVLVGAFLLPPSTPEAGAAVIFFNNEGYLGMCGHGTIGLVHTLAYLDRLPQSDITLETPAGIVRAKRHVDGRISVANVASYRYRTNVPVEIPDLGTIHGDIAYGGNWFFLCNDHGLEVDLSNEPALTQLSSEIYRQLAKQGITGADGAKIDHVELFGPPTRTDADSKNYVLCPGLAYDRSPCGTGTSAKLACLAAAGKLAPDQIWRQESIIGSLFEGRYEQGEGETILPTITARAYVTGDTTLIFEADDPFAGGIR